MNASWSGCGLVGGARNCRQDIFAGKVAGLILDLKCSQIPGSMYLRCCQVAISPTRSFTERMCFLCHFKRTLELKKSKINKQFQEE